MRKVLFVLSVIVLAVGIAGSGFWFGTQGSRDKPGVGSRSGAESPVTVAPEQARGYFAGQGTLVLRFRELTAPLLTLAQTSDVDGRYEVCADVAARLDVEVDPSKLLGAAQGIPDAGLAEMAVDDRAARSTALIACGRRDQRATDAALMSVDAVDALFLRRFAQVAPLPVRSSIERSPSWRRLSSQRLL